jgi:hypothetical protein
LYGGVIRVANVQERVESGIGPGLADLKNKTVKLYDDGARPCIWTAFAMQ